MKRAFTAVLILAIGCGSGSTEPPVATSIHLTPSEVVVKRDSTRAFIGTVLDQHGVAIAGVSLTYAIVDTAIAKFAPAPAPTQGVVSIVGVKAGPTTLTATSGSLSAQFPVAVLGAPACSTVVTQPLTLRPYAAAVSRQGVAYVGSASADTLARADLPITAFSASVRVRREPTYLAFDTTGTRAYVTDQLAGQVSVIDVAANAQIDSIIVTGNPFIVKVSPDNQTVWVSSNVDSLYAFDRTTKAVVGRFGMPLVPNGITFSPANDSLLYASTLSAGQVIEINYKRMMVGRTFTLGGTVQGLVVSLDGSELYVANEGLAELEIVNLATGTSQSPVAMPGGPFDIQLTPDGLELWISIPGNGRIQVLDRASRAVLHTVLTAGTPRRLAFDRFGTILVAANEAGWVDFIK